MTMEKLNSVSVLRIPASEIAAQWSHAKPGQQIGFMISAPDGSPQTLRLNINMDLSLRAENTSYSIFSESLNGHNNVETSFVGIANSMTAVRDKKAVIAGITAKRRAQKVLHRPPEIIDSRDVNNQEDTTFQ